MSFGSPLLLFVCCCCCWFFSGFFCFVFCFIVVVVVVVCFFLSKDQFQYAMDMEFQFTFLLYVFSVFSPDTAMQVCHANTVEVGCRFDCLPVCLSVWGFFFRYNINLMYPLFSQTFFY